MRLGAIYFLLLFFIFSPHLAHADCAIPADAPITIEVKGCKNLDPKTEPALSAYPGEGVSEEDHFYEGGFLGSSKEAFLEKYYKGALVETDNRTFMYPSLFEDPCSKFPVGQSVTKVATYACCDTGAWGKCIFGGEFLYDEGGPKVDAFQ